jgi:5-methylcytosine-specific restriction protein A
MVKRNFGILASMSWNSNKWASPATKEDIAQSNYDYVKENGWMHEDLNFGYDVLPCEEDGTFIAYTPMFNTFPSAEESRYVEIVFSEV